MYNSLFRSKEEKQKVVEEYPEGTIVVLDKMDDIQAPPVGTKGKVQYVDDACNIHVSWETGSGLALVIGVDKFHKSK